MKNSKIPQLDDNIESNYNKPRNYSDVTSPQKSKGKYNYSTNPLVDLMGSQTTTNKNNSSHNEKAYSLSHIKKSELYAKNKAIISNNSAKINLHVSTQTSKIY